MRPYALLADSHDRPAWLEARRQTIGASEAPIVLGASPWSSQLQLWAEKTGRHERDPELDRAEWIFWGQELEPAIISGYGTRAGRFTVPFGLCLRSTRFPWLSATPDALVTDDAKAGARRMHIVVILEQLRAAMAHRVSADDLLAELEERAEGWWPLQTKNIGFGSAEHWHDGVPLYYRIQCVQEALVFGSSRTTGAALIAGQRLAWDDVDVDLAGLIERQIVHLTCRFMREHIEADVEPAVDGSDSARQTLAALYPREVPEKVVLLDANWMDQADLYDREKAEEKALEARLRTFENRLRQQLQDAERALLPDGSGFTFKCDSRGSRRLLRKKARGE